MLHYEHFAELGTFMQLFGFFPPVTLTSFHSHPEQAPFAQRMYTFAPFAKTFPVTLFNLTLVIGTPPLGFPVGLLFS